MAFAFRIACLLVLVLPAACAHRPPTAAALPGEPVAPGVALLRGEFVAGRQPDGNTVLIRGRDALVVVDSGRHAAHTQRILDAARATGLPIAAIVNTHWHLDHVAGNAMLRAAHPQAEVVASDAIRAAMGGFLADYRMQLLDAIAQAPTDSTQVPAWREELARIDAGARLFPTRTIDADTESKLGGRDLQFGLVREAASGGDVWIFDPATRALVAGDLVTLPVPLLDTACPDGWRRALDAIAQVPFDTLVPGHGAPMTRAGFDRWREAYAGLIACAASGAEKGACAAAWLDNAGPLVPESDMALARSSLDYYVSLLRTPAHAAAHCRTGDAR